MEVAVGVGIIVEVGVGVGAAGTLKTVSQAGMGCSALGLETGAVGAKGSFCLSFIEVRIVITAKPKSKIIKANIPIFFMVPAILSLGYEPRL